MIDRKYKIPLLVVSCDKYSDLWLPFFSLFWKRWGDCPYSVFLGSNEKTYNHASVNPIKIGIDTTWAGNLVRMLDSLNASYVLLFLDDFLIQQPVNTPLVEKLVSIAIENEIGCLRLGDSSLFHPARQAFLRNRVGQTLSSALSLPVPDFPDLGIITPGTPYRVSTQVGVWRTETLRHLLLPRFNIWQFEEIGTQLSVTLPDQFWSVRKPAIVYDHGVEKGKWKPEGVAICREAGVKLDIEARSAFTEQGLQAHYLSCEAQWHLYQIKCWSMENFLLGRRSEGLQHGLQYLKSKPLSVQMWAIILLGLVGRKPISWLKSLHFAIKVFGYRRNPCVRKILSASKHSRFQEK